MLLDEAGCVEITVYKIGEIFYRLKGALRLGTVVVVLPGFGQKEINPAFLLFLTDHTLGCELMRGWGGLKRGAPSLPTPRTSAQADGAQPRGPQGL